MWLFYISLILSKACKYLRLLITVYNWITFEKLADCHSAEFVAQLALVLCHTCSFSILIVLIFLFLSGELLCIAAKDLTPSDASYLLTDNTKNITYIIKGVTPLVTLVLWNQFNKYIILSLLNSLWAVWGILHRM